MTPLLNANGAFYRPAVFGLDPQHAGALYLGTDSFNDGHSKGLWKTADCGSSWMHISTGRNGDAIDGGRNWTFAIDPTDSKVMYINGGYYKLGLLKSTNGCVDWDDITPANSPGFVSSVRMDPSDSQHLLMDWHTNCGAVWSDNIGCFHESKDGGKTWTQHSNTPPWPGMMKVWILHGDSWIIANGGVELTTNGGQGWKPLTGDGAGGHSAGSLYQAKNGHWYLGTASGVLRSKDDGPAWDLVPNTGALGPARHGQRHRPLPLDLGRFQNLARQRWPALDRHARFAKELHRVHHRLRPRPPSSLCLMPGPGPFSDENAVKASGGLRHLPPRVRGFKDSCVTFFESRPLAQRV
jgi:hypothetical protein